MLWKRRVTHLHLFLALFVLFVGGSLAVALEEEPGRSDGSSRLELVYEGCESQSKAEPSVIIGKQERDSFSQQMHEARMAGDMETFDRLRSQLRTPNLEGDAAGKVIRRQSDTCFLPGDPALIGPGMQKDQLNGAPEKLEVPFGTDRHVRELNLDTFERHPSVVTDLAGNDYVAWQDDALGLSSIQFYTSEDGGKNWTALGVLFSPAMPSP
ncbi:MAG: hypothetical protein ACYTG7_09325 [Planctomycetota bacterium]|jgi:hypothetical protein